MESIAVEIASLISLAAVLSLSIRSRRAAAHLGDVSRRRQEEIVGDLEQIKRTCFISLENLHRSLDALQIRADAAERQLSGIVESPQVERKGHYEAAALLLEAGQSVERVATMIDLPADQVALVQELRRSVTKDAAVARPQRSGLGVRSSNEQRRKKRAPRAQRERVRPILLTDVVDFDSAVGNRNGHPPSANGAAA